MVVISIASVGILDQHIKANPSQFCILKYPNIMYFNIFVVFLLGIAAAQVTIAKSFY